MFKIEGGGGGVRAILNELPIGNFPKLLISSLTKCLRKHFYLWRLFPDHNGIWHEDGPLDTNYTNATLVWLQCGGVE